MMDRQVQQLIAQSRMFTDFLNKNQSSNQPNTPHNLNVDQVAAELQEILNRSLNIIIFNLQDRSDVMQVLRNRRNLPAELSVSDDRTKTQLDALANLRLQVREHNAAHPEDLWRIKFINNTPVIVSMKDLNPIQKNP